jgi:hypothetical protein
VNFYSNVCLRRGWYGSWECFPNPERGFLSRGLGRLSGCKSLPAELLDWVAQSGQLPSSFQQMRNQRDGWDFQMILLFSVTNLGKRTMEIPLVGKGNVFGGRLLPEMKPK